MRERETEHHMTGEKAQTFNPETFGLPAPMFTKRTRLVDNVIIFGKFEYLIFFSFIINTITVLSLGIVVNFLFLLPNSYMVTSCNYTFSCMMSKWSIREISWK